MLDLEQRLVVEEVLVEGADPALHRAGRTPEILHHALIVRHQGFLLPPQSNVVENHAGKDYEKRNNRYDGDENFVHQAASSVVARRSARA